MWPNASGNSWTGWACVRPRPRGARIFDRRRFLAALSACAAGSVFGQPALSDPLEGRRVLIVGAGWGGLATARELRRLAPDLHITLIDRQDRLRSLPLSNAWLAGFRDAPLRELDYAALAARLGYRFVRAGVSAIDRETRRVHTDGGVFGYDWLVLAAGIRQDYTAWFGEDRDAAEQARKLCPSGMQADELPALKRLISEFRGGDLVMSVPPAPSRCPPAAYERAMMLAWMIRQKGIPGRVVLVEAGAAMPRYSRLFAERYEKEILHLTHTRVRGVDLAGRRLRTEFDDIPFSAALLAPPQQAADPVWQAGLVGRHPSGSTTGWAAVEALSLQAVADERVYVVGDAVGAVSLLFGAYPKTAHMAVSQGRLVAKQIAARAAGRQWEPALPETLCHIHLDLAPEEMRVLDGHYRLRADGVLVQTLLQHDNPVPKGEQEAWFATLRGAVEG